MLGCETHVFCLREKCETENVRKSTRRPWRNLGRAETAGGATRGGSASGEAQSEGGRKGRASSPAAAGAPGAAPVGGDGARSVRRSRSAEGAGAPTVPRFTTFLCASITLATFAYIAPNCTRMLSSYAKKHVLIMCNTFHLSSSVASCTAIASLKCSLLRSEE